MAPQSALISSLSLNKKDVLLHVRATRIWESFSVDKKSFQSKMLNTRVVFIDEEQSQIMLTVWNNQKQDYFPLLKEGDVYDISQFRVVPNLTGYRIVNSEIALSFDHNTKVIPKEETERIPLFKFELTKFEDIPSLLWNTKNLIEVAGLVTEYGDPETASNGAKKIDVVLLDSSNRDMIVTLWEEKANVFQNDLAAADDGAAFVIITGLLVKKYSGKDIVLSSGDATRTYFNIDYAPLKELSQSMIRKARERGTTIPPPRKKIFVSTAENALKVIKIQDILEVELPSAGEIMRFICEANIINVSKYDGWYYNSCPKCPKGIRIEDNKFYCDACKKETDGYTQRYKIIIGVQDDSGRTTFALLNNDAEQLIGVPVRSIISDLGQDNLTQDIPPVINNIIGRRCAFEVKVSSYNRDGRAGYTVGRLIEMPGSSSHVKAGEQHDEAGPSKKARLSSPK